MAVRDDLKSTFDDDGTKRRGVFYKEHPSRKHGAVKDKQFVIRYTIAGETRAEVYGWLSHGYTARAAQGKIESFRANYKAGSGPTSLKEERKLLKRNNLQNETERKRRETTFSQFWHKIYYPQCMIDKTLKTANAEKTLYECWIKPVIGELLFDQVSIDHMETIKANMMSGKREPARPHPRDRKAGAIGAQQRRTPPRPMSARSINYAFAVVRQVWNRACSSKPPYAFGGWPGASKSFKKPKLDNMRKRFLTRNEAALLLDALRKKSQDLHDMALLALHCGMRASEIFNLNWDRVHLKKGTILLVDTKNGESRTAYMTDEVKAMLRHRSVNCKNKRYVFITKINGEQAPYYEISATFARTVKELGLNDGVTDKRDKVVFHTLRHTFASWLVEGGTSLPIVRDRMGHKTLIMTSRYSHVSAKEQKNAVASLNETLKPQNGDVVNLEAKRKKMS